MRTQEVKKDPWRMDLAQLKEITGKDPVDVRVEGKYVAVYYDNNTRVLFKQW